MSVKDFHRECRAKWVSAIESAVGPTPPRTAVWQGAHEIVTAIAPFTSAVNHMLLPGTGGGLDVAQVTLGHEPGTIEFVIRKTKAYLAEPRSMTLEYIAADPGESFVIVDVASLSPSGIYDDEPDRDQWREDLVELSPGNYVECGVWDRGYFGHDASGNEIPLPENARQLLRIFRGRLILVAKGSRWNSIPETYQGSHDRMTNEEIRGIIERWISSKSAEEPVE